MKIVQLKVMILSAGLAIISSLTAYGGNQMLKKMSLPDPKTAGGDIGRCMVGVAHRHSSRWATL